MQTFKPSNLRPSSSPTPGHHRIMMTHHEPCHASLRTTKLTHTHHVHHHHHRHMNVNTVLQRVNNGAESLSVEYEPKSALNPIQIGAYFPISQPKTMVAKLPCNEEGSVVAEESKCLAALIHNTSTQFMTSNVHVNEHEFEFSALVRDFMETNGDIRPVHSMAISDENNLNQSQTHNPSNRAQKTLQEILSISTLVEKEIMLLVTNFLSSVDDDDDESVICDGIRPCEHFREQCIYSNLLQHLRISGYDAAICNSKWLKSGSIPGGEHQYIDVIFDDAMHMEKHLDHRFIVDIDFRSQFQIARPTLSYVNALKALPSAFIGSFGKLMEIISIMAEATKLSMKNNGMPLPPWRTYDYMTCKWKTPCERICHALLVSGRDELVTRECTKAHKMCRKSA